MTLEAVNRLLKPAKLSNFVTFAQKLKRYNYIITKII